jgi:serine/threonine-protein kinase
VSGPRPTRPTGELRALWAPIEALESAEGSAAASGRSYRPVELESMPELVGAVALAVAPPGAAPHDSAAPTRLEGDASRADPPVARTGPSAPPPLPSDELSAPEPLGDASSSAPEPRVASSSSAAALPLNAVSSTLSVPFEPAGGTPGSARRPGDSGPGPGAVSGRHPAGVESFELLERIGQGGMGVVFRAVQASLGREVAVKQAWRKGERAVAQFIAEAQIAGRLEHANIVPVHLLGRTPDGTPQLAMKLVKGTSWKELLHGPKGAALSLKDHVGILLAVCNAVAFAHERGFIHRDLKPENVMVGEFGQVFVMDWGLAIPLARAPRVRAPAGTPCYMAPELAAGDGPAQGPHTDVYLLGACLHEVVTRRRRHEGSSVYGVLANAIESAPFAYDATVPGELAAICNCATACDPAERYQSVAELRRAIERFLEHREAHAITEKGTRLLGDLRRAIASLADTPEGAREGRASEIHRLHAELRFAFRHALSIWPGAPEARAGLRDASRVMLEHALAAGDVQLAASVLAECEDPAAAERVGALRERIAARERELAALRESARRHDWSTVADPLGTTFMAAAFLGGAGAILSKYAIAHAGVSTLYHPRLPWIALCIVVGVFALVKLRNRGITGSLVSPRVLGTWGAVAIGCALTGLTAEQRGAPPFRDACYQAWMIGIGFAAMGFESQRWLLAPALAFFAGGCVMVFTPQHNPEVFGTLWFIVFTGVGVALKRSSR